MYYLKQFLSRDVIISPLKFNKKQTLSGQNILDEGVRFVYGEDTEDLLDEEYQNYLSSLHKLDTYFFPPHYTLYHPLEENPDEITEILIPPSLLGEGIHRTSFKISYGGTTLVDDGEGNIHPEGDENSIVGNIMYNIGLILIYDGSLSTLADNIESKIGGVSLEVYSIVTIIEHQYKCIIDPFEFKLSLNPTLLDENYEINNNFVDKKFFSPYITTIGLYNSDKELVAIAKLSKPVPSSKFLDTTLIVKFDQP
jgi:hypothetical protein